MTIRNFLLGQGEFKSAVQVVDVVQQSKNFDCSQEDLTKAEALLIFQTSKQQTWLVATRVRLYCVLDDLGKSFTRVQWSTSRNKLIADGKIGARIVTRNKTERTGLLDIGEHRGWLFSKRLFTDETIESRITNLIARQMLQ
jgi:hypothetical protein